MKVKDFLTDVRMWVIVALFFIGIGLGITGWTQIPGRVDKAEEKIKKNEDQVEKFASEVREFKATQQVRDESQEKIQQLLVDWIKESKEK